MKGRCGENMLGNGCDPNMQKMMMMMMMMVMMMMMMMMMMLMLMLMLPPPRKLYFILPLLVPLLHHFIPLLPCPTQKRFFFSGATDRQNRN